MLEKQIREKLGSPIKICMACALKLSTSHELEYGLCDRHWGHITKPPYHIKRDYGRGVEYQMLHHTDDLDDIIFRLEYDKEPTISLDSDSLDLCKKQDQPSSINWLNKLHYLIYAHYIAKIYLEFLCHNLDLNSFDYITMVNSHYSMEFIFLEMGYLAKDKAYANLFLSDKLHFMMQEEETLPVVADKRILLLDLYRSYDTRECIDRLKWSGAREIITVYLTSYS